MIKVLYTAAAAGLIATAAACSQTGGGYNEPVQAALPPAPTQAGLYVAKAGASDLYEIQSSQLAMDRAGGAQVRDFARMMIEHHTMTTREVTAAAQAAGLNPRPPALEPMQADMVRDLHGLSGAAFDRAYVAQQRTAHEMALNLHQTYAARGDNPRLRTVASRAVPIIRQHIAALDRIRT